LKLIHSLQIKELLHENFLLLLLPSKLLCEIDVRSSASLACENGKVCGKMRDAARGRFHYAN
jgi:hypothetical protein